jgi:hypothetical protein
MFENFIGAKICILAVEYDTVLSGFSYCFGEAYCLYFCLHDGKICMVRLLGSTYHTTL